MLDPKPPIVVTPKQREMMMTEWNNRAWEITEDPKLRTILDAAVLKLIGGFEAQTTAQYHERNAMPGTERREASAITTAARDALLEISLEAWGAIVAAGIQERSAYSLVGSAIHRTAIIFKGMIDGADVGVPGRSFDDFRQEHERRIGPREEDLAIR